MSDRGLGAVDEDNLPRPPILATNRLVLRPFVPTDAETIQRVFPRWEIVQYLGSTIPWPYPADGAKEFVDGVLASEGESKDFHWAIALNENPDELIGVIGLHPKSEVSNRGFWLSPEYWRQGLMSEATEAVTDFWFDTFGDRPLVVDNATANTGSRRVKERIGAEFLGSHEFKFVSGLQPAEKWRITKDIWEKYKKGREQ